MAFCRRSSCSIPAFEVGRVLGFHLEHQEPRRLRLEVFDDPQHQHDEHRAEDGQQVQADAGRQADRQRGQHHAGLLVVIDLGAVAHQAGSADNAERPRQAGADDEHHQCADDGEDDLRLDHRRLARGRAAAARPHRHQARQACGKRQAHGGLGQAEELGIEIGRVLVDVGGRFGRRQLSLGLWLLRGRADRHHARRHQQDAGEADEGDRHRASAACLGCEQSRLTTSAIFPFRASTQSCTDPGFSSPSATRSGKRAVWNRSRI